KATEDYNLKGTFRNVYMKTLKSLSLVSLPIVIIVLLFGATLFEFVFGEEWRMSGVIAQVLILMFVMKLIVSPLSYTWYIINRLNERLYIHLYMLISNFVIFY